MALLTYSLQLGELLETVHSLLLIGRLTELLDLFLELGDVLLDLVNGEMDLRRFLWFPNFRLFFNFCHCLLL